VVPPTPSPPEVTSAPTPPQADDLEPVDEGTRADAIEAALDWRAFVPTDVADHLATMDRAARESNCGVPWQLLASIARVESDFGRNMATSTAGAVGYGQFLPSSWDAYASGGNVYDYHDALPAIAQYLCHAGLDRDPRTALFAYNHADWYVDLVLNLAVRYDRLAPGAPTPEVLQVGPAEEQGMPMRYALGRDLRQQSRAHAVNAQNRWLGVPWRGRSPGQPIGADALLSTSLSMLRGEFGLGPASELSHTASDSEDLGAVASAAWDSGLLAEPGQSQQWTVAELRLDLQRGQPVMVFVGGAGLPGHPLDENFGEQPLVLIGATASGFIYSDPSFSSSLGYGLEMSSTDLESFWDQAARPRQALAFAARPRTAAAHVAPAVAPVPITRVELRTPVPVATTVSTATERPQDRASSPVPNVPTEPVPATNVAPASGSTPTPEDGLGPLPVGVLALITLGALRWWRARRSI
jgi:Transglycosylase SLT domain